MRRWIGLAAGLYPGRWRERYGEEFDALLEDHNPGWREFTDVLREALKMQMTNTTTYWKLAGSLAIAGAIAATAASFSLPRLYQSTAVMRMTPQQIPENGAANDGQDRISSQLNQIEQEVLSRTSLEGLITQPGLDLYKEERARRPMENIVQQMRERDLRIRALAQPAGSRGAGTAFAVSFSYPDQRKAQAVVREVVTKFAESNVVEQRYHVRFWQSVWPGSTPPPGENLEVLDPPSLPLKPISPNRVSYAAWGLFSGLMLGLIAAVGLHRPKWTLQMTGFGAGCCALAFAISLLFPETYTSNAVMRMTSAMVPESLTKGIAVTPPADKLQGLKQAVLSDASLSETITKLDLKETVETMRRDLSIHTLNPSQLAFQIAFSYPDPSKAQAVVRSVVRGFSDQNVRVERARARASGDAKIQQIADYKLGENLEVLDPPSKPQQPRSPNRLALSAAGFVLGLLLGATTLYFRQHRRQILRTA